MILNSKLSEFYNKINGKKIAVCGVGVNNAPVALLLAKHGADVTACDKRSRAELGTSAEILENGGVKLCLGEHYLDTVDIIGADMILRTPGMQPFLPQFKKAHDKNIQITSDIDLFLGLCPAQVIAVTGSDGKTTTATIIAGMLEEAGYSVHLGGNIGRSLLPETENITARDKVVVELSSFQLMDMKNSPHISVVTNVSPNHLDWHTDMKEYIEAKEKILINQTDKDRAVLNADDDTTLMFAQKTDAKVFWFSKDLKPENGAFVEDGAIHISEKDEDTFIIDIEDIALPGMHNVENYMAAFCAVWGTVSPAIMAKFAKEFTGVAHRCEFVRETGGVKWYNDSIGSSPSRTIAGLKSFGQKVVLIAGGYDKKIPYDPLGEVAEEHISHAVLLGQTAEKIEDSINKYCKGGAPEIVKVKDLAEAIEVALKNTKAGDIVLFSPASASFDMYKNFEERGNHFKKLVNEIGN